MKKFCIDCGKPLSIWGDKFCPSCAKKGSRNPMFGKTEEKHHNWKGGYIHPTLKYKLVNKNKKKSYEHRVIAEEMIGRKLLPKEVVHHINGNKSDNRPDNLQVISSNGEHITIHNKLRFKERETVCPNGHLFAEVGYYMYSNSTIKRCNLCVSIRGKKYRDRKKEEQKNINQTKYRGVQLAPSGRYRVVLFVSPRYIHLGTFDTAYEAAKIYDKNATRLRGNKAKLNFPKYIEKKS